MPVQITLIGLGRTGASLGLAFKGKAQETDLKIIGHDIDIQVARAAHARGAIDVAEWNLPAACEKADAIYLCVPLSEMRKTMEEVIPNAKPACVITDTAPLKAPLIEWAAELMPEDRYYIGGTPILNPAYLHDGSVEPRADLFKDGLWALVPDANASPEALKLINDLARLIGSTPFFVGATEFDALIAHTSTLPGLAAAALVHGVAASPQWADARKLADRTFATATAPAAFISPGAIRAAALLNGPSVLHALDTFVEQMTALRKAIAEGDASAIESRLTSAAIAREAWLEKRRAANWETDELPKKEMPTATTMFKQMVGLGRWGEKKK